jgi:hypothetical protein
LLPPEVGVLVGMFVLFHNDNNILRNRVFEIKLKNLRFIFKTQKRKCSKNRRSLKTSLVDSNVIASYVNRKLRIERPEELTTRNSVPVG